MARPSKKKKKKKKKKKDMSQLPARIALQIHIFKLSHFSFFFFLFVCFSLFLTLFSPPELHFSCHDSALICFLKCPSFSSINERTPNKCFHKFHFQRHGEVSVIPKHLQIYYSFLGIGNSHPGFHVP